MPESSVRISAPRQQSEETMFSAADGSSVRRLISEVLCTQTYYWQVAGLILFADTLLTGLIIWKVPYTEIDFSTYIQQAGLFLKGERMYTNIKGNTGLCVYPAGHLYVYSFFYWLTDGGAETLRVRAQIVFGAIYLVTELVIMDIYKASAAPPLMLPLLILSKRLHSISVLRLFNDPIAMLFLYVAVRSYTRQGWNIGAVALSLALSIKMNILLFLPALATVLFRSGGIALCIKTGVLILSTQLALASPFFLSPEHALAYLSQAFNLSRAFLRVWTVNWAMIDEQVFLSKSFARTLLLGHASGLAAWGLCRWTGIWKFGIGWVWARWNGAQDRRSARPPSSRAIAISLFTCNLLGLTFARSLHYQFYAWYAQQLPLLLWTASRGSLIWTVAQLALFEFSWLTFPATSLSSSLLFLSHLVLLARLWRVGADDADEDEVRGAGASRVSRASIAKTR